MQRLLITRTGEVVPVPVGLEPISTGASPAASPTPSVTATSGPPPTTTPTPTATPSARTPSLEETEIRAQLSSNDGRRSGSFTDVDLTTLPLGAITLVRTFDQLALLLPGVAPPPQTIGNGSGPGVGAGVGAAGQFSINGLRSRANNFTVDGSDNNDEDIGVRRQGFVALIPQPIESIQEYHIITLLAPAQFGRNIGAQVNAVSRSGGSAPHGTLYGFFNASQLNARNFFDTTNGNARTALRVGNQAVLLDGQPLTVQNQSDGKDSFTFGQAGFVLGGPLKRPHVFYFLSAEGERTIASQEASFAVPTVAQRGIFRTGASGIFLDPFTGDPTSAIPASRNGAAIFSLFPLPNNPNGLYGANTFTQVLPASGQGKILSAKLDGNFKYKGRQQSVTERYNYTDDFRIIPVTGGALFSSLRPRVRTQNSSLFFNSEVSALNSARPMFNQVRLSYGRTRLGFDEIRDRDFLVPSVSLPRTPFLLNAPLALNTTTPAAPGQANTGPVTFLHDPNVPTVEDEIGPIGAVNVAGFSPIGVDVFNFPQQRVNNTYQVADELTWRSGVHAVGFGVDTRRSELNSDLPRNSRPLVTFNGGPRLIFENGAFRLPTSSDLNRFIRPEDLAALGAASNFYLTLNTTADARNSLRYYQLNLYAQDAWRLRPNLSLSYGLRYEYNTPVRELNRRIEQTFTDPGLALAPGLRQFIEGRTRIFEPDRNNFAPRIGMAYSLTPFGKDRRTVLRGGYGIFYDQILGAVVSQSRNVFPTFITLNFGGLNAQDDTTSLTFFNPATTFLFVADNDVPLVRPGTPNDFNPALSLTDVLDFVSEHFPSALGATLPARRLVTPAAQHYSLIIEQQCSPDMFFTVAYVGTQGRHLLRFTTPNLGPGSTLVPVSFHTLDRDLIIPEMDGRVLPPMRPVSGVGAINRFETSASSRYDALQLQLRGRFHRMLQYQASYTLSKATDDVSDVFDLAGAPALPQNSLTLAGERGLANFDTRQRFTYQFIYDFPRPHRRDGAVGLLRDGWQIAGTGRFQTGQPFTVNSIFDVNLDGNLTDRLNTTQGLVQTTDRRRPLRLTVDPLTLLAPVGQDGSVGRNTFRAGNVLELDMTVLKRFAFSESRGLTLRADIFNFINRANFGVPVRYLEAPSFGQAINTVTPGRRVQLALKYTF
ncbi:MAG TPA: TonB-dependent receptor [Pyrinomonadaceae bacterium]